MAEAAKSKKKQKAEPREPATEPQVPPRLRERFRREIIPALTKQFRYKNVWQVPRPKKVVINMGLGEAVANPKVIDAGVEELSAITGQRPVVTRAKKSEAGFKLRTGNAVGCKVTLRGDRMYEFLDRFLNMTLPRIRDFKGVPAKSFDGRGNYSLGVKEHLSGNQVRQGGRRSRDGYRH
jgi:large subunit ribosomal protein L5